MPFKRIKNWLSQQQEKPEASSLPKHFGEIWDILQNIAREEDPQTFKEKMAAQHAVETVEGKKDVDRWLQIYMKRVNPQHPFKFPDHHPRHRGHCLIPRHWPSGTLWEAFNDETFMKVPLSGQTSHDQLIAELDQWIEKEGS